MSPYTLSRRQSFQPSCPIGGQWYACEAGSRFVGCCDNEPCSLGCKQGNLKPASFDAASYGSFPDLECNSGNWYTCAYTIPPFMGCCESNPCTDGCSTEDLAAGHLGNNEAIACQFYANGCPSTSSSTQSVGPSATTNPEAVVSGESSTGAIVGGAVGGGAGLLIVVILLFYCYRHTVKSRKAWNSGVDARNSQQSVTATTDGSEATTYYQAYSPSVVQKAFPSSPTHYPSHHARSYSHELSALSPSPSELPSDASPHLSHSSPMQPSELSATSPIHTTTNWTPTLGLGLNVPSDQTQHYPPASSPTITRRSVNGSTSPNLSELSANTSTRRR